MRVAIMMLCGVLAVAGCANTASKQMMGPAVLPTTQPTTKPAAAESHSSVQAVQQSGQGNLSGQVEAGGWKGIEYSSAVPVGQVVLMGMMLILSHRREMARIKIDRRCSH